MRWPKLPHPSSVKKNRKQHVPIPDSEPIVPELTIVPLTDPIPAPPAIPPSYSYSEPLLSNDGNELPPEYPQPLQQKTIMGLRAKRFYEAVLSLVIMSTVFSYLVLLFVIPYSFLLHVIYTIVFLTELAVLVKWRKVRRKWSRGVGKYAPGIGVRRRSSTASINIRQSSDDPMDDAALDIIVTRTAPPAYMDIRMDKVIVAPAVEAAEQQLMLPPQVAVRC
jgi:hypothetical protein